MDNRTNKMIGNIGVEFDGQFRLLGAYMVDGIICHYAFTDRNKNPESDIGLNKIDMMRNLGRPLSEFFIPTDTQANMLKSIRNSMTQVATLNCESAVLFMFERTKYDDYLFYGALGLRPEEIDFVSVEELGLTLSPPADFFPTKGLADAL
ncbi:hypothetical protein A6E01_19905 (plasmid) [Vibrio breoganii]|uniref:Uncharacterized protein n=1 Tax=Vibrio breoganii TaxID=553239 RepID=A0AAN1CUC2_9VIBR|nr:hypothetical protein [Vibrio breoganii]ANO35480.1 hypothetical protein A6E01_19905 [Vibrio breoganii]PML13916.1 hypothetical protein BCT84_12210 [Vibrio breoganii]